jgi:hypothetical protein
MKSAHCLIAIVAVIMLVSCSTGVNKDFSTGLSVSYDGLSMDKAYLVGGKDKAVDTDKVPLNSEVSIVVQGVGNYELKDGKAYPGLALTVMDENGKAVIDEQDLFAESDGYPPTDAAILRGTITVGAPMKSGATYHVQMRVWDKNKTDSQITAEVEIKVE